MKGVPTVAVKVMLICAQDDCGVTVAEEWFTVAGAKKLVREAANDEGWKRIKGKWYCPDCIGDGRVP